MKIRFGYVSNSSTSSFVCGVCGAIEAARDCSLSDFEMKECVHGHIFHTECCDNLPRLTNEQIYTKLKTHYTYNLENWERNKKKYEDVLKGVGEPYDYEKNYGESYFKNQVERSKDKISQINKQLNKLDLAYTMDDFGGKYEPIYEKTFYDEEVPEEYCPVCNKLKEMKNDPKYEEYVKLYEHFGHYLPSGEHS